MGPRFSTCWSVAPMARFSSALLLTGGTGSRLRTRLLRSVRPSSIAGATRKRERSVVPWMMRSSPIVRSGGRDGLRGDAFQRASGPLRDRRGAGTVPYSGAGVGRFGPGVRCPRSTWGHAACPSSGRRVIDWLTLRCDRRYIRPADWDRLAGRQGLLLKLDADGVMQWQMPTRESVRSDSHQLQIHASGDTLQICGSPARVVSPNNVFGTGSPVVAWAQMLDFVDRVCNVGMPRSVGLWKCSRIDVTLNYDLGSPAEVRQALQYLRHAEGGRYQVRTMSESVYWGVGSRTKGAKAYHKGPHAAYQDKKQQAEFSPEQLVACDRLLRLELALRGEFWRHARKAWHQWTEGALEREHQNFFGRWIGSMEVCEMDKMLDGLEEISPSRGQALAAYRTWSLIRAIGRREAEASMPKATWYRHLKLLRGVGLSDADLAEGNVIPFRRRVIELGAPVRSWGDLGGVAA